MQEVQRPLLTPDECMRLKGATKNTKGEITEAGDMLIFVAGYPAIYGKQILYFKDDVFVGNHHSNFVFFLFYQLGNFRQCFTCDNKADFLVAYKRFTAQGQAVAIHGNDGDVFLFNIKQGTCMDWLGVCCGNGKQGLVYHGF